MLSNTGKCLVILHYNYDVAVQIINGISVNHSRLCGCEIIDLAPHARFRTCVAARIFKAREPLSDLYLRLVQNIR